MAYSDSDGFMSRIMRWFSGEEREDRPVRKSSVTEALERVAKAEERLMTVEEATMSLTVGDLPASERAGYEADEDDDDWFDDA